MSWSLDACKKKKKISNFYLNKCSAKILKDVKCTSFIAIKDDVENAGGIWIDEAVVVDKENNIITSRTPNDLTPFCQAIIKSLL